jgi:hypothetical protein
MSMNSALSKIGSRAWSEAKDAWLSNVPQFDSIGEAPNPGVEFIVSHSTIQPSYPPSPIPDIEGLRRNILWEAMFLFQKCVHTRLAAERLGGEGMQTWSMFNAYHSAFLGAKGIMALLGVAFPRVGGAQTAIDVFPATPRSSQGVRRGPQTYSDRFKFFRLPGLLEQQSLWEAFQRVLRTADIGDVVPVSLIQAITSVPFAEFSPPRNRLLYQCHFWQFADILTPMPTTDIPNISAALLDSDDEGFLLKLCFVVHRVFSLMLRNLAVESDTVATQLAGTNQFLDDRAVFPEIYSELMLAYETAVA